MALEGPCVQICSPRATPSLGTLKSTRAPRQITDQVVFKDTFNPDLLAGSKRNLIGTDGCRRLRNVNIDVAKPLFTRPAIGGTHSKATDNRFSGYLWIGLDARRSFRFLLLTIMPHGVHVN